MIAAAMHWHCPRAIFRRAALVPLSPRLFNMPGMQSKLAMERARAAIRKVSRSGWRDASSRRMRRVLRTMAAPILSSLTRIVAAHARSSSVPDKAKARRRSRRAAKARIGAHHDAHLWPTLAQPRYQQFDHRGSMLGTVDPAVAQTCTNYWPTLQDRGPENQTG